MPASGGHQKEEEGGQGKTPPPEGIPGADDPIAPEPAGKKPTGLSCPLLKILEMYHSILPDHPKVLAFSEARKRTVKTRWREWERNRRKPYGDPPTMEGALDFWARFFAHVGRSKFLTGQGKPRDGQEPFIADFDFLMGAQTHFKVAEGFYHREKEVVVARDEP